MYGLNHPGTTWHIHLQLLAKGPRRLLSATGIGVSCSHLCHVCIHIDTNDSKQKLHAICGLTHTHTMSAASATLTKVHTIWDEISMISMISMA